VPKPLFFHPLSSSGGSSYRGHIEFNEGHIGFDEGRNGFDVTCPSPPRDPLLAWGSVAKATKPLNDLYFLMRALALRPPLGGQGGSLGGRGMRHRMLGEARY
jgi:hypothetical protein